MTKQRRGEAGKFAAKSSEHREVRSIRLTDTTWEKLGELADSRCITRADLIEQMVDSGELTQRPSSGTSLQQIEAAVTKILNDPQVTRNGKDRGSVRRALEALLKILH